MQPDIQVTQIGVDAIDDASQVVARAFFNDPLLAYVEPDEEARRVMAPEFMGAAVRYAQRFGKVFVTAGEMRGVACWIAPGFTDLTEERMMETGAMEAMVSVMSQEALGRFMDVSAAMDAQHHNVAPGPHWYLLVLATEPSQQRNGIGSALIQAGSRSPTRQVCLPTLKQ